MAEGGHEAEPSTLPGLFQKMVSDDAYATILGRSDVTERRSLSEIWDDAGRVAAGLLDRGFSPRDKIAVVGSTTIHFLVASLAVFRAGMVLVPLPGRGRNVSKEEAARVAHERIQKAGARAVLGRLSATLAVKAFSVEELRGSEPVTVDVSPDDLALIQFSSGTTSAPKGAMQLHRTIVNRVHLRSTTPLEVHQHYFSWYPVHTGAGFSPALTLPFGRGKSTTLIPSRYLMAEPQRWLIEIDRRGITDSGGPTFLYESAAKAIERGLDGKIDLSGWIAAAATAELIQPAALLRFAQAAAPLGFRPEAFQTRYASTEAGNVTDGRHGAGLRIARLDRDALAGGAAREVGGGGDAVEFLSNGLPLPGVDLQICDAQGDESPEREVGQIIFRSPALVPGYFEDPEINAAAFVDGWYRSGDAGFLSEGELFITGRVKDMMIVRGRNVYPQDVENAVHAGVEDVTCCAFTVRGTSSEEIVLVVEAASAVPDLRERAKAVIWRQLGLSVSDVVVVGAGGLPRTAAGKLQRHLMKSRYESGDVGPPS